MSTAIESSRSSKSWSSKAAAVGGSSCRTRRLNSRTAPQHVVAWNSGPVFELCSLEEARKFRPKDVVNDARPVHIQEWDMHQIIYIVGLIVVILAILSFFGLR